MDSDYEESNGPRNDAAPLSPSSQDEVSTVGVAEHLEDGDLLFFEGSPFHFLDSKATVGFPSKIKSELHLPTGILSECRPTLAPRPSIYSEGQPLQYPKLQLPRLIISDKEKS